ncbi:hypothetical protein JTE90_026259 [Oedothorax gibbosus]|uniref:Endonuclease/exonuclease/phosphatase domain-containing protein n=1 Tax=Oedothorax gibbosus TaxID=931172 RepID=A0AAV6TUE6_9ARAC|nr:hypothetical protein JTE90_026259 [Oedothorax gibbosus]
MEEGKKRRFRGQKRPRKPTNSASTPSPGAPVKRPNLEQASGSFAEAAAAKKMAIILEGFPERLLSTSEAFNLQNELDVLIDDAAEGHEPRFSNAALSNGALIMHCIGADAVELLKSINGKKFGSLDTAVKTLDAAELPKPYKLIFKTKNHGLTDQSILLRRLAKQNPGLSTAGWRVLSKDKAPTYMRWVLEVPEKAATFIRQHNNELFCGAFGKGICKLIGTASPSASSTVTSPVEKPPTAVVEEETPMQVSNDIADNAPTDSKVVNPADESDESGWKVIVSCDANAHHIIWGSKDCNNRGEELLLYILSNGLSILNRGNSPTFITSQRSEVIDVTFCNAKAVNCISNWHVSERDYLSDHRLILFNLSGPLLTPPTGNRNPRKVDWDSYREELGLLLGGNVFNFPSLADIDMTVDNVQSAIVQSFNSNSRVASSGLPRRVPWWSKDLGDLRKECRKLFNKAKKTGDWSVYKMRLTAFNKAVRKAKQDSWKDYCSQMEELLKKHPKQWRCHPGQRAT